MLTREPDQEPSRASAKVGSLSFTQELLLAEEVANRRASLIARIVRIDGPLDPTKFLSAGHSLVAAHDPLRSVYEWQSGVPVCRVVALGTVPRVWRFENEISEEHQQRTVLYAACDPAQFDASKTPQMRSCLLPLSEGGYLWSIGVNHLAADAISMLMYADTFRQAYEGAHIPTSLTNSIEYARIQRDWLTSTEAQDHFEWWLKALATGGTCSRWSMSMGSGSTIAYGTHTRMHILTGVELIQSSLCS